MHTIKRTRAVEASPHPINQIYTSLPCSHSIRKGHLGVKFRFALIERKRKHFLRAIEITKVVLASGKSQRMTDLVEQRENYEPGKVLFE